jgi:hypothetical protein
VPHLRPAREENDLLGRGVLITLIARVSAEDGKKRSPRLLTCDKDVFQKSI